MFKELLDRLLGKSATSPLDRAAARETRRSSGRDYAPRSGAIGPAQLNPKQRLVADLFLKRVRAYCANHQYDFAAFQGPFLWPANDPEGRRIAAVVLGPPETPGYEVWELEVGSPHGTIGGFGDSSGQFKVYRDGMVLPDPKQ